MQGMTGEEALKVLAHSGEMYARLIATNEYDVGIYKPDKIDMQSPNLRDEIYIVISGHETFHCDGEDRAFEPGDMLFVPRGVEHRFGNFTSDFATWVVFFGAVRRD